MIGDKTQKALKDACQNTIDKRFPEIKKAFLNSDGHLSVSFKIKIAPAKKSPGGIDVSATLDFVLERVTETYEVNGIVEDQKELF